MITTTLTGNLGNNMWYYAVTRIVAEKLNFKWGISNIPVHDYYSGQNQMYFMNVSFGEETKVIGRNSRGLYIYEGMIEKLESYGHQEFNNHLIKSGILSKANNDIDILNRNIKIIEVNMNEYYPQHIIDLINNKFKYLIK